MRPLPSVLPILLATGLVIGTTSAPTTDASHVAWARADVGHATSRARPDAEVWNRGRCHADVRHAWIVDDLDAGMCLPDRCDPVI